MSYAAVIRENLLQQTGARPSSFEPYCSASSEASTDWSGLWCEVFRTHALTTLAQNTVPVTITCAVEALPVGDMIISTTTGAMLSAVEKLFGDSATDMAKMLRVSRPMVYHYREGVEPSVENKRRLQTLAILARDLGATVSRPLKGVLKAKQLEGGTLLEFLSAQELDVVALRGMLQRVIANSEQTLRKKLADSLAHKETVEARGDIKRERHMESKPIYVGDPDAPGMLIQIRPDGSQVHGRMVKRQFVPNDE